MQVDPWCRLYQFLALKLVPIEACVERHLKHTRARYPKRSCSMLQSHPTTELQWAFAHVFAEYPLKLKRSSPIFGGNFGETFETAIDLG